MRYLSFQDLRVASQARQEKSFPEVGKWTPGNWGTLLAAETGEVCSLLKDIVCGKEIDRRHLAQELADVVISADLVAQTCGIDLGKAVAYKFNVISERVHSDIKLASEYEDDNRGVSYAPTTLDPMDVNRIWKCTYCGRNVQYSELVSSITAYTHAPDAKQHMTGNRHCGPVQCFKLVENERVSVEEAFAVIREALKK